MAANRSSWVTFGFFTLFPLMLWMSGSFAMLLFAFAIRGLKEFGDTSRKALIIGYCAPERRGQMIGAYYLVRDLLVSAAALIGAYLWQLGPAAEFPPGPPPSGLGGTVCYLFAICRDRPGRRLASRAGARRGDPPGFSMRWHCGAIAR